MKNDMQLKAIIKNFSIEKNISAQLILQNFMFERILERISISKYQYNFILKGGFLIAAIVGLNTRATMDIDVTLKGEILEEENIKLIFNEIFSIPVSDNIEFKLINIVEIRKHDNYPEYRVSLFGNFKSMSVPLKLDITTGDKITPKEIKYEYRTLLDNRSIIILAYNLETILAEKLETILSRGDQTTRIRDYYDVYILWKLQQQNINIINLKHALEITANKRKSIDTIKGYQTTMSIVMSSSVMKEQWIKYQKNFDYAKGIEFDEICNLILEIMNEFEL